MTPTLKHYRPSIRRQRKERLSIAIEWALITILLSAAIYFEIFINI
jgi:hypothetical protein